jgi:peroxiredoxin
MRARTFWPLVLVALAGWSRACAGHQASTGRGATVSSALGDARRPDRSAAPPSAAGRTQREAVRAPAFDLAEVSGRRIRLDDLRGKAVLLNFWAFWCDTWKAEMPDLRALAARQADLNFQIVSISVDGTRLPEFGPAQARSFPVALDIGGEVTRAYGVEHVPTVILIDAEGRIRYRCVAWPGSQTILNELRKQAGAPAQEAGVANAGAQGRTGAGRKTHTKKPRRVAHLRGRNLY